MAHYRRILLKLSGESLCKEGGCGIDPKSSRRIATEIKELKDRGIEIGVVLGGGNIFRGVQGESERLERVTADQIGMMATILNGLYLSEILKNLGCAAKVLSSFPCGEIVETYRQEKAIEYLEKKIVVIFVGGTGLPYFTTDTAAALKACEIKAEVFLKATKVDGVYDKDPLKFPDARKYESLTYAMALEKNLKVMDATSIALCRENRIPVYVFNFFKEKALLEAVTQQSAGSLVKEE
jgi:uridylate kinase